MVVVLAIPELEEARLDAVDVDDDDDDDDDDDEETSATNACCCCCCGSLTMIPGHRRSF